MSTVTVADAARNNAQWCNTARPATQRAAATMINTTP
jgi:hypothetical protein